MTWGKSFMFTVAASSITKQGVTVVPSSARVSKDVKSEGHGEDVKVAICLVVQATSSPALLEGQKPACTPDYEASRSHSASKPICKQQLLQGDERVSRRPCMANHSHAANSSSFYYGCGCFSC